MLHSITSTSLLPRDLLHWLNTLDLSYALRNPRIDLANGFLVAEILSRKYGGQIQVWGFYNQGRKDRKVDNWKRIQTFLAKKNFKLTNQQYQSIINLGPQTAQSFIFRLYEHITESKLNVDRRLTSTIKTGLDAPFYKKPTASYLAKDRELERVVDDKDKKNRTLLAIKRHKEDIGGAKFETGLVEWMVTKRKQQLEQEISQQQQAAQRRTKLAANSESRVEIREISLKCFNSSTSKKNQGQYGEYVEEKGIIEFLTESCALLFKKDSVVADLKKLNIEIKEKDPSSQVAIQQIINRCDETDAKGQLKLSQETMTRILELFKRNTELNMIIDNIGTNFLDFRKFFFLMIKPLTVYSRDVPAFKQLLTLLSLIANGLRKEDPQNTEMLFEQIILGPLLKIGENEYKRVSICQLLLSFLRKEYSSAEIIVRRLKESYGASPLTRSILVSYLAHLLDLLRRECTDRLDYNLWSEFYYYGFSSLHSASPTVRTNGAKILATLFTDVVAPTDENIGSNTQILLGLTKDRWWEVRIQALVIYKAILLSRYRQENNGAPNGSAANINYSHKAHKSIDGLNASLTEKTAGQNEINGSIKPYKPVSNKVLLDAIHQIFQVSASSNILRIGLIELAELLNYEPSLCSRYIEVLLHVEPPIRADILNTSVIKYGPVVFGAGTFTYKLTGAPLEWSSIGVARVLQKQVQGLERLDHSHLIILCSAIGQCNNRSATNNDNTTDKKNEHELWFPLFEAFKRQLFSMLLDAKLCELSLQIIKSFVELSDIHRKVIDSSKGQLKRILSLAYAKTVQKPITLSSNALAAKIESQQSQIKLNLLGLFTYLRQHQPDYTYEILKQFAQGQKQLYLESNLIDFMNELSRERRKRLYE